MTSKARWSLFSFIDPLGFLLSVLFFSQISFYHECEILNPKVTGKSILLIPV